jgi:hypothetical protein
MCLMSVSFTCFSVSYNSVGQKNEFIFNEGSSSSIPAGLIVPLEPKQM